MPKDNMLILGFGGGSMKVLNYIHKKEPELNILSVDQDKETLLLSETDTLLFDGFDSLYEKVKNADNIVVILALGGYFGTYVAECILEWLADKNLNISVIATLPFRFEGNRRVSAAKSALNSIQNIVFDTTFFNIDKILDSVPENITVRDAYNIVSETIYGILREKFLNSVR